MKTIFFLVCLVLASPVLSNEINFEIYELTNEGNKLLHKENLVYNNSDITVLKKSGANSCSDKRLILWEKFGLSSCVYREPEISGFGLSIDKNHGGFSWEWFSQSGNCNCDKVNSHDKTNDPDVYQKLQGSGAIKIEFIEGKNWKEIISFEFLEDITMRGNLGFFGSLGGETHHIVIKKGSVFSFKKIQE